MPPEDKVPGPRYVVANADESEPGCFKDRVLITRAPHQLLEGLLIASYAIGAKDSFIFIRGEYQNQYDILERGHRRGRAAAGLIGNGTSGDFDRRVTLMRGAGAYISGLDTALLETMEGQEGLAAPAPALPDGRRPDGPADRRQQRGDAVHAARSSCANGGEAFAKIGSPRTAAPSCSPFPATSRSQASTKSPWARSCATSWPWPAA